MMHLKSELSKVKLNTCLIIVEKSLIMGKEVQQTKDKFENLEWQQCVLKNHTTR
jgi:hypothetical protein